MANHPPYNNYPDIGNTGEDLVAQWLKSQGWVILHRRWRCRWGEIDIIAQDGGVAKNGVMGRLGDGENSNLTPSPILAFVEVKTRSPSNWDAGGRNAIALQKQVKLWRAAQMFLVKHPQMADYPCRFDVAIVSCQQISTQFTAVKVIEKSLADYSTAAYRLTLQEYIPAAFELANDNGE
ncbi:YraN family protein [Fischerella sp. PCC 9605]|uniref:YraN family protein n=1 Tax=Fischerella sp. PCC 9605 TaxID=1173024 RepID=UPI00047D8697|nr:YraN family protein [Fischerella sp. PCC 9605]